MQIEWITVAAQIANFLVLVWLLQRFLYRPIKQAMTRREEEIEKRLAEAKTARQRAEDEAERLRRQQTELQGDKDRILEDAKQEAQTLRDRLETDIRDDMEGRRDTWRDRLVAERDSFASTLQGRAGHQVIAITRQMLQEYAHADLTDQIASGFIARLEDLEEDRHHKLAKAVAAARGPALIESSVTLSPDLRQKLTRAVHAILETDIDVHYREDEDLVLGIRLCVGEQTLEWSAARHLKRMDDVLDEAISRAAPPRAAQTDTQSKQS